MNQSITSYYEQDHDRLDELFKKFQEWKQKDFVTGKEYFVQFKFGLQRHIVWEEDILFPLFERKTGMKDSGPTAVMRMEHKIIKEALEGIHHKVQTQNHDSNAEEAQLISTLSQHNQKEENILYPSIDRLITPEERTEVFRQMKELPEERYRHCCEP